MTRRGLEIAAAACLLLAPEPCRAAERAPLPPLVPHFAKLQSGGYLGFLTLGAGYAAFADRLTVTGYVGWVPAALGGKTIVTPAFAVSYRPVWIDTARDVRWWPAYVGLGGVFGTGGRFPVFNDDAFPPPGIRFLGHLGTEVTFLLPAEAPLSSHAAFVEVTALDRALILWLGNEHGPTFWDVWSTSLGYKASF